MTNSILWLDDMDRAGDMLAIRPMPVLVFNHFWQPGRRRMLDNFLDFWNIEAYFFEPFEADVKDGFIVSTYKTDCFEMQTVEVFDDIAVLEKIGNIKGVQPSYLWAKTFLQRDYSLKVLSEKTEFMYVRN